MRLQLIGGFLGAGKTTLIRALAAGLRHRGERVAIITNDQGRSLVDTALCREAAPLVGEITGGCFCCRYDELESALDRARQDGATVAIAEAVGSCTDLVATVLSPLVVRQSGRLAVEPLAVVVDPWRLQDMTAGCLGVDVGYLFRKQIEEADILLVARADLDPPDIRASLHTWASGVPIIPVSGITGAGIDEWLASRSTHRASPLMLDYDRYARAEAALGWSNARVRVAAPDRFDPFAVLTRFLELMRDTPVAHIKYASTSPPGIRAALTRSSGTPVMQRDGPADLVTELTGILNARIALEPEALEDRLRSAMAGAAGPARVEWQEFACFRPGRPAPTHRHSARAAPDGEASCCAAFYQRPDVQYLLGDSYHPGGLALTLRMARHLALGEGRRILDVACGTGNSLKGLCAAYPVQAIGIDASVTPATDERLELRTGNAHALDLDDASVDAILCECALSTFTDRVRALGEMRRVLRPGGRLALSDMLVNGALPAALKDWVHGGTCLRHALTLCGYRAALEAAGFRIVESWDASGALSELLSQIKRRVVGLALAGATGNLPAAVHIDVKQARLLLREAERAVAGGTVGYAAFIAEPAA